MNSRRNFILSGCIAAIGAATSYQLLLASPGKRFVSLPESLTKLEKDCNGRLGVFVLDTGSGESSGHRANERFAMCSTFKMLLASAVLHRADTGKENLERAVAIPKTGFLNNSPITQQHAGGSMMVRELCEAAMTVSDNTAANLLLATIGDQAGYTKYARSIGDSITRLDRTEPSLNEAQPGDPRDTTSPAAMVADWRALLLGDKLSSQSRKQLTEWLIANKTGDARLRAGIKSGWGIGDKTGSNGETTSNDVAIIWPTGQAPVIVAAYLTACPGTEEKRNTVLANVGRLVAKAIQTA